MEGFIVVEIDEATGDGISAWDGTVLQDQLGASTFYPIKENARFVAGTIQSQYPEKAIVIASARQTYALTDIRFAPPAPADTAA